MQPTALSKSQLSSTFATKNALCFKNSDDSLPAYPFLAYSNIALFRFVCQASDTPCCSIHLPMPLKIPLCKVAGHAAWRKLLLVNDVNVVSATVDDFFTILSRRIKAGIQEKKGNVPCLSEL